MGLGSRSFCFRRVNVVKGWFGLAARLSFLILFMLLEMQPQLCHVTRIEITAWQVREWFQSENYSSQYELALVAIDGNTDGRWNSKSVTETSMMGKDAQWRFGFSKSY